MLRWVVAFLMLALVAAVLGLVGLASGAPALAALFFALFLGISAGLLFFAAFAGGRPAIS